MVAPFQHDLQYITHFQSVLLLISMLAHQLPVFLLLDIVFFGESLPERFATAVAEVSANISFHQMFSKIIFFCCCSLAKIEYLLDLMPCKECSQVVLFCWESSSPIPLLCDDQMKWGVKSRHERQPRDAILLFILGMSGLCGMWLRETFFFVIKC